MSRSVDQTSYSILPWPTQQWCSILITISSYLPWDRPIHAASTLKKPYGLKIFGCAFLPHWHKHCTQRNFKKPHKCHLSFTLQHFFYVFKVHHKVTEHQPLHNCVTQCHATVIWALHCSNMPIFSQWQNNSFAQKLHDFSLKETESELNCNHEDIAFSNTDRNQLLRLQHTSNSSFCLLTCKTALPPPPPPPPPKKKKKKKKKV